MKEYAVITGDIVSSRQIETRTKESLYIAIDDLAKSLKRKWIDKYERYRGDGIQFSLNNVGNALKTALLIRCFVLSYLPVSKRKKTSSKGYINTQFDIRLAIGIGGVDFINEKKLSSSDGEAFVLSGLSLDNLKKGNERMIVKSGDDELNGEWETITILLDAIMQKWTQNGAELILQKLWGKKDDEIAGMFNVSLSAITQRKKTRNGMRLIKQSVILKRNSAHEPLVLN